MWNILITVPRWTMLGSLLSYRLWVASSAWRAAIRKAARVIETLPFRSPFSLEYMDFSWNVWNGSRNVVLLRAIGKEDLSFTEMAFVSRDVGNVFTTSSGTASFFFMDSWWFSDSIESVIDDCVMETLLSNRSNFIWLHSTIDVDNMIIIDNTKKIVDRKYLKKI